MTDTSIIPQLSSTFSDSSNPAPESDAQAEAAAMAEYQGSASLQQYVAQEYGDLGWMMAIPELQSIIVTAAANNWDEAHISSALDATSWWKQNGQSVAEWQQLQATDPAQAAQQVNQEATRVRAEANTLGVQLDDTQIQNLASLSAEFQFSDTTLSQTIGAQYSKTTSQPTSGTAAQFQDQATAMIQSYAVPVSNQALAQWTSNAVAGTADINGFEDYLRNQAKVLYPFMSTALDNGVTPQSFLSPYTSAASTLLGVSEGSINWSDPKWLSAVTQPGPGGESTPASLTQFQNTLRTDPNFGWSKTADAVSTAYTTAKQVAQTFGKVGA